MSALTLAMLQLKELNVDDYVNVRAFCFGVDPRAAQHHPRHGAESPTSESSGVSSYGSGSSDRDSMDLARMPGRRTSIASTVSSQDTQDQHQHQHQHQQQDDQNNAVIDAVAASEKEEDEKRCHEHKDHQVMYQGRDILNLGGNIRQSLLWHMNTPHVSPFTLALYTRSRRDRIIDKLRTKVCKDCGFVDYENSHMPEVPTSQPQIHIGC